MNVPEPLLCAEHQCQASATGVGRANQASAFLELGMARRVWGTESEQVKHRTVLIQALKEMGYDAVGLLRIWGEGPGQKEMRRKKDSAARGQQGRKGTGVAGVEVGEEVGGRVCVHVNVGVGWGVRTLQWSIVRIRAFTMRKTKVFRGFWSNMAWLF